MNRKTVQVRIGKDTMEILKREAEQKNTTLSSLLDSIVEKALCKTKHIKSQHTE